MYPCYFNLCSGRNQTSKTLLLHPLSPVLEIFYVRPHQQDYLLILSTRFCLSLIGNERDIGKTILHSSIWWINLFLFLFLGDKITFFWAQEMNFPWLHPNARAASQMLKTASSYTRCAPKRLHMGRVPNSHVPPRNSTSSYYTIYSQSTLDYKSS